MAFSPWRHAMTRSICSKTAVVALALVAALRPGPACAASDASGLEAGRSAGRALLILRDPNVCGIALMHERCVADVDAFLAGKSDADFQSVPKIGPRPATGLRAFVTSGDRNGFDNALVWFNSRASTAAMWSGDARGAALFDAGVEDVVMPAALGNQAVELLGAGPIIDLVDHAGQIPPGTFPIDPAPLRRGAPKRGTVGKELPPGAMTFARDLVVAIDAAMPPPPFATLTYADGALGDAALGVAAGTVNELVDSPNWLVQADAQRFIDGYTARLAIVAPGRRAEIATLRAALRADGSFSHDGALKANTAVTVAILRSEAARTKPVLLGVLAAQLVYNAAALRDTHMSGAALRALGTEAALDAAVPGWKSTRATAIGIAADDWGAQYQVGLRLIALIRSANRA
jgi:hypothetical protein